jgi:acetyl-CoA acetyltransferase
MSTTTKLRGTAAISGVGESSFDTVPGKSALQFASEAALAAFDDAGVSKAGIDGLVTAYSVGDPYNFFGTVLAEYLGVRPGFLAQINVGGSVGNLLIAQAVAAIATGQATTVLCVWADNRRSALGGSNTVSRVADLAAHPAFELPFGPLVPSLYALMANRYLHEYGVGTEALADVAVATRAHAARHPRARRRELITRSDVLNSPMVSTPLHALDCCLISDYGAAAIVTAADRAPDLARPPVWVLGTGEGTTHEFISQSPSLVTFGSKQSGRTAFARAGLTPSDIDVAYLYDCFTITVLLLLEELGFCGPGEAGDLVASGATGPGGTLPVNTHGGLLSYSNGGFLHVVEAVRQLRGEADGRQVDAAATALVHLQGGVMSTHSTVILGNDR